MHGLLGYPTVPGNLLGRVRINERLGEDGPALSAVRAKDRVPIAGLLHGDSNRQPGGSPSCDTLLCGQASKSQQVVMEQTWYPPLLTQQGCSWYISVTDVSYTVI
jgi:hypothetical protein